jgi:rod shape-determining protein MreD
MKDGMIYLAAGLVALFLQTTIFSHFPVKPDFVLVLVVCLGLSHMTVSGAVLAFLLGCLNDVFAGSTPGFFALTKTLIFFFVYATRGRLYFESYLAKAGLVSIAVLIEAVLLLLLVRFTSSPPTLPFSVGRLIIGPVLVTTLVAPLCFMLLRRTRISFL